MPFQFSSCPFLLFICFFFFFFFFYLSSYSFVCEGYMLHHMPTTHFGGGGELITHIPGNCSICGAPHILVVKSVRLPLCCHFKCDLQQSCARERSEQTFTNSWQNPHAVPGYKRITTLWGLSKRTCERRWRGASSLTQACNVSHI